MLAAQTDVVMYSAPMSALMQCPAAAEQAQAGSVGGLLALFAFFHHERSLGTSLVLATLLDTAGTTYRKRGAFMLIRDEVHWHGLLSGGCLEGDLAAHSKAVLATGEARVITYDLAAMNDTVWGFGLGCDGSVRILLQRLDAGNSWEPFASVVHHVERGHEGTLTLLHASDDPARPAGQWLLESASGTSGPLQAMAELPGADSLAGGSTRIVLPRLPRLVVLGAGADAGPLVQFAVQLGWRVAVVDHRASHADPARFPGAEQVVHAPDQRLPPDFPITGADAIVIMSHNLAADERYLAAAVASATPYIGLLGPAARRDRLLATLGDPAAVAAGRIHGPVGLDLGGEGPEAVALSIVAEIQAGLHGRQGVMRRAG